MPPDWQLSLLKTDSSSPVGGPRSGVGSKSKNVTVAAGGPSPYAHWPMPRKVTLATSSAPSPGSGESRTLANSLSLFAAFRGAGSSCPIWTMEIPVGGEERIQAFRGSRGFRGPVPNCDQRSFRGRVPGGVGNWTPETLGPFLPKAWPLAYSRSTSFRSPSRAGASSICSMGPTTTIFIRSGWRYF